MRGIAPAWLSVACALLVAGCGKAAPAPAASSSSSSPAVSATATASPSSGVALDAHFENASVAIDYPSDWTQRDLESGSLFVAPGGNAVVGVEVARWSKTLAKLAGPAEDVEKGAFASFQLDASTDGTLDGRPALELRFHGALKDGTEMRGFALWSVVDGRAYRFGFKANQDAVDALLPVAAAMMDSYRVR